MYLRTEGKKIFSIPVGHLFIKPFDLLAKVKLNETFHFRLCLLSTLYLLFYTYGEAKVHKRLLFLKPSCYIPECLGRMIQEVPHWRARLE